MSLGARPALQARCLPLLSHAGAKALRPLPLVSPSPNAAPALAPPILATELACHHRFPHQIRASPTPADTYGEPPAI